MRWNGFGRSLLFAAVAALGWLACSLLLGPLLGRGGAFALYSVTAACVYVVGIAPDLRGGLASGGLASALGVLLLLLPLDAASTAVGAALVVALCRSAILYRARPLRAIAAEVGLLVTGLGLAWALIGASPGSWALAVWGYFLVQSAFFLLGGVSGRPLRDPDLDPFERARARLLSLVE